MTGYRQIVARVWQWLLAAALLAAPAVAGTQPHIAAALVSEGAAPAGGTAWVAIAMTPAPGWHGYWQNPGDAGVGLTLAWTVPAGVAAAPPRFPVPDTLLISGLMNHVYAKPYAVLVPMAVPAGAAAGQTLPLRLHAAWLACSAEVCVPEQAELAGAITVAAPGTHPPPDPRFDSWRAALPAPLGSPARFALAGDVLRLAIPLPASVSLAAPHLFVADSHVVDYAAPQRFSRRGDVLIAELARARFAAAAPQALTAVLRLDAAGNGVELHAAPGAVPPAGDPLAPPAAALPLLLLSALLGGLVLNAMPCVFPILSLKALALARAGESAAQARREGVAYTAGVVLACLGLGTLLLVLRAGGEEIGWAFQLQEPLVVAGLALLAIAIAANLFGLYEFAVPGFAGDGSPRGAFATGLLAAFAATPCVGPFLAAALGAALVLPAWQALALFSALGLGLALPFLALGWIPALRQRLPRPGPWMNTFRRVMAVPMALTAAALVWLASHLAGATFAALLAAFGAGMLGALFAVGMRQRRGIAAAAPAVAALALALAALLALPRAEQAPAASADDAELPGTRPFSEAALTAAVASGRPVFVYFTADWCLVCKVNERVALGRADTRAAFARERVIVLRGDWTRRDAAIGRFLAAHGAAGVPYYLYYPGDGKGPVELPQVLTPATLAGVAGSVWD